MNKFKTFLYAFRNSAFKPKYYADILKTPFSFSVKYFVFLFLFLSFITVLSISYPLITDFKPALEKFKNDAPKLYPTELVLDIKNGLVSTNVLEPYFIPLEPSLFPEEIKMGLEKQPIQNILVIDTSVPASEIKKYQTVALLTRDSLAILGDNNEIRIQTLEEIKEFHLDKEIVKTGWGMIVPYFKYIIPGIIIVLIIFVPLFTLIGKFFFLMFFSLITLITARLFSNKEVNYSKAIQLNLHAITLPIIIVSLFQAFGAPPKIPFFQSGILLIFNLIIFSSLKENSEEVK
ncbi:hypothetical protein COT75_04705 [Candidatus Beckwithbacteria bacterium CG10_big_fil_rev_8_21_14_0_10_34_10]|uniref:DUF1189 domain-containing protein n=1 Tax=Candidatus Beckwithbacteria bacterium CG10_big_fil_rev_8_21_14_0_10_34_10 TaxID=1974495 RepID=A0A2H0W7V3_9BACT|nr:MAG: hypothetical protein COT75_04705 [Candidatus Beckwithbacteria bacterium CG10_big_fil_rev_8_21_14_0_10_34_10]